MFVKQIAQNEALSLAAKGVEIMIMVPDSENNVWGGMTPDTLQNLLSGLMFFRREPALENPIIEDDEKISTPPTEPTESSGGSARTTSSTDKPATNCVASGKEGKKRVAVDTGKLLALRKAGWTIEKIADELSVSTGTVCNYLKKLEEERNANS